MSDENSAAAGLAAQNAEAGLARENAELRARLAQLTANVVSGQFQGEAPRYRLNGPCQLDDTFFEAGTEIDFLDTPNLDMVPLNEPAKRATRAYIEHLERCGAEMAALRGRRWFGLELNTAALLDQSRADAQTEARAQVPQPIIQMPVVHGQVPAMGHMQTTETRRGPGRPRKAVAVPSVPRQGPVQNTPTARPIPGTEGGPLPPAVVGHRVA